MPVCRGGCAGVWSSAPTVASTTPIPVHATLRAFIERLLSSEPELRRVEGLHGGPGWNPRTYELRLIERLADVRLPRRISGATADLLVERRDALPDGRARGSGLPFERDREKADSLRQAIDLLVRLPELAREPRATRGRQADVRQRSAAGENRPDGLDRVRRLPGGQLGAEQRHSEPGAGGIDRDGRAQQGDASRSVGRALRSGQPRRHEHRSIGRGRRQVGPRAQPVDFRLRLAAKHSARRGKRTCRFDANGVGLLRRLGHPR